jgi:hypothetical protein
MKYRALLSVVVTGFAATACAILDKDDGIHPMGSPQSCDNSAKCIIPVVVTACTPDGVSVDDWHVQKPNVVLEWTLSGGYQFDRANGVKFKEGSPDWRNEFHSPSSNGGKFVWHDKNDPAATTPPTRAPRTYSYSLTILKPDGSFCVTKDPIIVNDL